MKEVEISEHSGAVEKRKSPSECLIIKKKTSDGGISDSTREKKRPRVAYERGFVENGEFETEKRVNNGLDERRIRKDVNDDSHRLKLYRDQRESGSGSGSGRMIDDKKKDFKGDNKSTVLGAKSSGLTNGIKGRNAIEDDDADPDLPFRVLSDKYREAFVGPNKLQEQNGVLKVMASKHRPMGGSHRLKDHEEVGDQKEPRLGVLDKRKLNVSCKMGDVFEAEDRKGSRSEDAKKKKAVARPSFNSDLRYPEKPVAELKLPRPMSVTRSKETDESERPFQSKSSIMIKKEGTIKPLTEYDTSVKSKESKVKRGNVTEKQLVREKIKHMLLGAGWTIDYRPRRNRDYLDSVYINPTGTGYWSITKAYEALQKEKEEEDSSKVGGVFTPLPDEILGKLTRQTHKKIEREMKKKRRDEGNRRNARRVRVKEHAVGDQHEKKLSSSTKYRRKPFKPLESILEEASQDNVDDSSDNSDKETPKQDRAAKAADGANSHMVHGRKSRKFGRCTLLVRSSDKGLNSENDGPFSGKRTILAWLIDSGAVCIGEKVQYMNLRRTRVMQDGWVTKDGIDCGCCSKILTVLKFELHAGSILRKPFQNIFIESGKSLLQCEIDAWNKQGELERKGFHVVDVDGDDPNDDTCGLCGDGGDLICCDGCPSTFHQSCLEMQMLPQGDWHCPNCTCKYCNVVGGSYTKASGRTESELLVCRLCEKKYHESCSLKMRNSSTDQNFPFCGRKCQELYSHLQKLLGVKHELDSEFSWSFIDRSDLASDTSSVKYPQKVECNSKLAVALSVMDECFLPIIDRRSGINLIHNIVYNCGSNISRLNYSGFFTAILERGDEMVCAASIRIHGTQLAEMPFIGTRDIYRRQGMCRRLLHAIESALSTLQVEKLIIPTVAEHRLTWTDAFGFSPLEESHKREMRSMNILAFPETDLLQKPLLKQGKTSVEVKATNPSTKEAEVCPNVKELADEIAPMNSNSQDPSAHLDEDCSVDASNETISISSHVVLPVLANKPLANADDISLDIPCLPHSKASKGDVQNDIETTDKTADADPSVPSHDSFSSYHSRPEPQHEGKELSSVDACFGSKVEEISVQNSNGAADANIHKSQPPDDVASHDPISPDNRL